jgi:hypothetical protein
MGRQSDRCAGQPERSSSSSGRRNFGGEPRAVGRPSRQRCHVSLGPGLVDEDQTLRLDPALILFPLRSLARDVGAIAFAGDEAFFEAKFLRMDEVPHLT